MPIAEQRVALQTDRHRRVVAADADVAIEGDHVVVRLNIDDRRAGVNPAGAVPERGERLAGGDTDAIAGDEHVDTAGEEDAAARITADHVVDDVHAGEILRWNGDADATAVGGRGTTGRIRTDVTVGDHAAQADIAAGQLVDGDAVLRESIDGQTAHAGDVARMNQKAVAGRGVDAG